jgi:4-amino-4-deoxy-L-arabinose transferase-like glycosyltransferase
LANRSRATDSWRACLLLFLFLGFVITFHLWFISPGHFNLAPDEAYYWSWSKRLDWSYYSKGPMVAYLIALSTRLGGDTEFFVRLPAVLLSAGTASLTFLLASRLCGSTRVGLEAVLLLAAMPLAQAGSILMTIDAPLVFFWSLTLFLIHRALTTGRNVWWLIAGVGLGLGLSSKYTIAIMVPQIALYLALSQAHQFWIRRSEPYLALAIGFLLFVPVLWWNATHGFVSLRHVLGQLGAEKAMVTPLKNLLEFIGSQVAVVTPLLFMLLMIGLWHVGRSGLARSGDDASLFLFCACAPLLLLCVIMSLWTKVLANWAAPAYVAAAIAAARWRSGSSPEGIPAWRGWRSRPFFVAALVTGFLASAIGHFPESLAAVGFALPRELDPTKRLRGWTELGARVNGIYQEMSRSRPTFVLSDKYQIASEMMFYVPAHPKTYSIPVGRRMNQFDVWGGTAEVLGWDAIFVTGRSANPPFEVLQSFESVKREWPDPPLDSEHSPALYSSSIFRCYSFRGFPPLQPRGY